MWLDGYELGWGFVLSFQPLQKMISNFGTKTGVGYVCYLWNNCILGERTGRKILMTLGNWILGFLNCCCIILVLLSYMKPPSFSPCVFLGENLVSWKLWVFFPAVFLFDLNLLAWSLLGSYVLLLGWNSYCLGVSYNLQIGDGSESYRCSEF